MEILSWKQCLSQMKPRILERSKYQQPKWASHSINCFINGKTFTQRGKWLAQAYTEKLFSSVQSLSRVRFFTTPWIAAHQASLSITNSQSSVKLMPIESVMPSSHLILCHPFSSCPQSLPASGSFPMSQLFTWGGQSTGVSASASFLPMNTQDWSPLGWTG